MEYFNDDEKYNDLNVFIKNNDVINKGNKTKSKPTIYEDFDCKNILIYTIAFYKRIKLLLEYYKKSDFWLCFCIPNFFS